MTNKLSKRLSEIVDALPLKKGMRVLEIGCGPGAAAREVAKRIDHGQVLAIDRSAKAIQLAVRSSKEEMASHSLNFRHVALKILNSQKMKLRLI